LWVFLYTHVCSHVLVCNCVYSRVFMSTFVLICNCVCYVMRTWVCVCTLVFLHVVLCTCVCSSVHVYTHLDCCVLNTCAYLCVYLCVLVCCCSDSTPLAPDGDWRQWGPYLAERQWATVRESNCSSEK